MEASVLLQVRGAIPTTPWELVLTSSPETQFVLVVLAVFSLVSWYLIVLKWWQFRKMRRLGDRFLAEVEKAARLEDAYHAAMRNEKFPRPAAQSSLRSCPAQLLDASNSERIRDPPLSAASPIYATQTLHG